MDKLQLYINISCRGYRNMLEINADEVIRSLTKDISMVLDEVEYDVDEKNIFYLLKYVKQGVFLTLIRTIPDHKPDHLEAWIFIPYNLNIAGSEIVQIVDMIAQAVNQSKITSDALNAIRRTFDRQYDTIEQAGAIAPNFGSRYAHRFYGESTGYILDDLIGKNRYQTSYLPYSGVILADKSLADEIDGSDLTDYPLEQMVKLLPPPNDNSKYRPMIFGQPFDQPFLAPLMCTVEVTWESDTAPAIKQSIVVNRPNMHAEGLSLGAQEDSAGILQDTSSENINLRPRNVTPAVNSDSHINPIPGTKHSTPRAAYIEPHKIEYVPNNHKGDDSIDWKNIANPLYDSVAKAIWGAVGFLIGIATALICTCSGPESAQNSANTVAVSDSVSVEKTGYANTPTETDAASHEEYATEKINEEKPKADDRSIAAAIDYLDNNQKWDKESMERYPDLKGLYDDMNNFRKERLYKAWRKKLNKSTRFSKVAEHASLGRKKKPRVPEGQKTYNTGSDRTINIPTYLNTIDP